MKNYNWILKILFRFWLFVFVLPLLGKLNVLSELSVLFLLFLWSISIIHQEIAASPIASKKVDLTQGLISFSSYVVTVSSIIYYAYFNENPIPMQLRCVGGVLLLIGFGLRFWSLNVLGRHFTKTAFYAKNPQLVVKLPYSVIRHPCYLGALLFLLGQNCWFGAVSLWNWITLLMISVAYGCRILIEEKNLNSVLHFNYQQYQLKTWRLLPFIF